MEVVKFPTILPYLVSLYMSQGKTNRSLVAGRSVMLMDP